MMKQLAIAMITSIVMAIAAIPQIAGAGSGGGQFFDKSLIDLQVNPAGKRHYYKRYKKKSKKKKRRRSKRSNKQRSVTVPVSTAEVRVQKALQTAGFYHGPLDGKLDSYDSRVAVMQYQQSHGLPQSGELSPDLKGVLLQQGDIAELTGYLHSTGTTQEEKGKRLQAALKVQGFYTATVDGDFGPKSRDAMRLYQQAQGMTPSGALLPDQEQELIAASIQLLQNQQMQANQILRQLAGSNSAPPPVPVVPAPTYPVQQHVTEGQQQPESSADQPPSSMDQHTSLPESELVMSAQQALDIKGYLATVPDGVNGPDTRDAVTRFQKEYGLQQSGELTPETLAALGVSRPLIQAAPATEKPSPEVAPVEDAVVQVNTEADDRPGNNTQTISNKTDTEIATLANAAEMKAEADVFAAVLAELPAGTQLIVNSVEGDWAHVTFNGQHGYVYAEYLLPSDQ